MRLLLTLALAATIASAKFNFASIGDWGCVPIGGWHEQDEYTVAAQFSTACANIDAKFILNTGDNFYYCGVHSKTDSMWNSTFESVFTAQSTMVPWYGTVGNHDYGYPGSVEAQIEYKSPNNNRWQIPGRYYYKRLEFPGEVNISLVVMDASPCQSAYISSDPSGWDPCGSVIPSCPGCTFHENVVKQNCSAQLEWLNNLMPTIPQGDWKIMMVHAPASDINVEDIITPFQQYNFDMYINGHVHLMAHYTMDNAGTYITTGAACMVRIPGESKANPDAVPKLKLGETSCASGNPFHTCQLVYQQTIAGYSTHSFSDDFNTLTTYLYDYSGNLLHTAVTTKSGGPQPPGPNPTSGPNPPSPPSPPGACCYYSDSTCSAGMTCCNEHGDSYGHYECVSGAGTEHNCVWTGSDCVVGSSKKKTAGKH